MGIGLHSGPVMSGNVGSARRLEYAAIGDTTNTAARLESMTKGTPYQLFVGEPTHDRLRAAPEDLEFVSELEVRGARTGSAYGGCARPGLRPSCQALRRRDPRLPAAPRPPRAARRPGARRRAPVPQGWLGVTADGPVRADAPTEWDRMVAAGVESVRAAVRWNELQPTAGAPPDFTALDQLVAVAASRGLALLPVVQGTPGWAADGNPTSPPADPAAFGRS